MEDVTNQERLESLRSFRSTIRKLEKAVARMDEKGASPTLAERRLGAQRVGLAALEAVWDDMPPPHAQEELEAARLTLLGLIPTVIKMEMRAKEGSPQKTLLRRRQRALKLAVQAIDQLVMEKRV